MPFSSDTTHTLSGYLVEEYGAEQADGQLRVMETWPEVVVYRHFSTGHLSFEQGVTLAETSDRALIFVAR